MTKTYIAFASKLSLMAIKQQSVSMPMSSAGMIGFSPDVKIEGREIEPRALIAVVVLFVAIVLIASKAVVY
ncbi:preprotein translocase subunit Sec61beta [Candidatus Micrarchaeota archaeon]|nr:preprotein translocase subunit Sec61beta [Candidatus Micrarchaeota archaeon]